MDKVVWVDEEDNLLGEVTRDKAHKEGLPHRVSVIYLINDKGEILVQHRYDGRLDHSSAGHVDPGETYLQAALRELNEELGIKVKKLELIGKDKALGKGPKHNENTYHVYQIFLYRGEPGKINTHEIKGVYWANPKEVLKQIEKDKNFDKYTEGFKVTIKHILKRI